MVIIFSQRIDEFLCSSLPYPYLYFITLFFDWFAWRIFFITLLICCRFFVDGADVDQLINTVIRIPYSSFVSFVHDTAIFLNGTVLAGNSLLYDLVARYLAAQVAFCGWFKLDILPDLNHLLHYGSWSVLITRTMALHHFHRRTHIPSHC